MEGTNIHTSFVCLCSICMTRKGGFLSINMYVCMNVRMYVCMYVCIYCFCLLYCLLCPWSTTSFRLSPSCSFLFALPLDGGRIAWWGSIMHHQLLYELTCCKRGKRMHHEQWGDASSYLVHLYAINLLGSSTFASALLRRPRCWSSTRGMAHIKIYP